MDTVCNLQTIDAMISVTIEITDAGQPPVISAIIMMVVVKERRAAPGQCN
jgi:hypothetical protein